MNTQWSGVFGRKSGAILGLTVGLATATPGVRAESEQSAPSSDRLEEIVVTAQKREERLQDVPISLTALPAQTLDKVRLSAPADLAGIVPNLQMQNTVGDETPIFALRGVSMSDFSLNQASPVATYYDEVYKGNFALFGVSMFDLERIEVLRGPQGTLYGKNTTGGAINFIARKPSFETEGYVSLGYGNYDRQEVSAALQLPLGPTVAARAAFTFARADGWLENRYPGHDDMNAKDEYGARLTFLWDATENLQFILRGSLSEQSMVNYGIHAIPYPELGCIGAGVYTEFHDLYPGSNPNVDDCRTGLGRYEVESEYTPDRENETKAVALTATWDISDTVRLTSVTSWDDATLLIPEDSDGSFLALLQSEYGDEVTQFAQDLRLSGTIGAFSYIVGAYYNKEDLSNTTTLRLFTDIDVNGDGVLDNLDCQVGLTLGLQGCNVQNHFDQTKKSTALYTDLTYDVSPQVTLRGGLRYTKDEGDQTNLVSNVYGTDGVLLDNFIPGPAPVTDLGAGCAEAANGLAKCTSSVDKLTAKLGVDYQVTDAVMVYASASTGFRAGAFNAQAFFQPADTSVAKPETVDAYEAGFKSQFAENRVTLNGAVFYYRYQDQQILNTDPETFAQTLVNLPRSRILGGELELTARPTPTLTLTAGLGLLDTEIEEGTVSGTSVAGSKLPSAPSTSASAAVDWDALATDAVVFNVRLDGTYASRQYFDPFNLQSQEAYALLNGRLSLRSADDRWGAAIWGKNLLDESYFTNKIDLPSFGFLYTHIGTPRMYGVTVDYKF
jgi:iron complex outermembrane receptor protein